MKVDKDNIMGIIGTVLFHGALLALFLVLFLRTEKPLPGEEGVLVNVGYMEEGTGPVQKEQPMQQKKQPPVQQQPQETSSQQAEEEVMTQETQEAPSVPDKKDEEEEKKKKKSEEEKEEPKKETEPEKTKEKVEEEPQEKPEPKEEKPQVNPKALYKGKSDSDKTGQDEGETGEPGDQGSPFGQKNTDNHEGEGGLGNGISFSLAGRNAKHLPKPEYKSRDQGKVVVTIFVDKYGKVQRAEAGAKGTTVTDLRLRKLAESAARRAKFSQNPEAPALQKGTITYNFIRMSN